jgi:hypothetical protein
MSTVETHSRLRRQGLTASVSLSLRNIAQFPRPWVYLICSLLAVAASLLLGKDTMWDTLAYHLYAGFSALHDRFGQDYFPAGGQTYFNPYVYVPYYLLARSGLSAVIVSTILAIAQSGIFWLTYELALSVVPASDRRTRLVFGIASLAWAFTNPILINQLGTSYVDILTAEVVLAGWLLLIRAVQSSSSGRIVGAGLLLGAVTALKLTNSLHAVCACAILAFLPVTWRTRFRYALVFCVAMAFSFAVVMLPWSLHLERHFGNPFFPLLNSIFRSPEFPSISIRDYRFIPDSLSAAMWRPFRIAAPVTLSDDEFATPDLRYLIALLLATAVLCCWMWRRWFRGHDRAASQASASATRGFVALGWAFLLDWIVWLAASGNGRYFISMACIAGILVIGLGFQLFASRQRLGVYILVVILGVQVFQLCAGATYRVHIAWDGGAPFEVSVPHELTRQGSLFLTFGEQSMSFLAPFLPASSGMVDLDGDYVIQPRGANGAHLKSLIARYSPQLRVAVLDDRLGEGPHIGIPGATHVEDTLAHFGLRADPEDCATIIIKHVRPPYRDVLPDSLPIHLPQLRGRMIRVPVSPDAHVVACRAVADTDPHTALFAGDRQADLVFNRLEEACPRVFQPRRPTTEDFGDQGKDVYRVRRYDSTSVAVMIVGGAVKFFDPLRGGAPTDLGQESAWTKSPPRVVCGRREGRYYVNLQTASPMQPP